MTPEPQTAPESPPEPAFCSLCGAEMALAKPWHRWCGDCRRDGLRGFWPAAAGGVLLAAAGAGLASNLVQAVLVSCFVLALCFAARVDANLSLLPDDVTLPLMWVGLLANLQVAFVPLPDALLGAVGGYLALWGLYWATWWSTKQEPFGYGDLKLTAALGAWLGFSALPGIFIGGAVAHSAAVLVLRLRGTPRASMPFGPALALAGVASMAWRLI